MLVRTDPFYRPHALDRFQRSEGFLYALEAYAILEGRVKAILHAGALALFLASVRQALTAVAEKSSTTELMMVARRPPPRYLLFSIMGWIG